MRQLNEYLSTKVKVDQINDIEKLSMDDMIKLLKSLKFDYREQNCSINGNIHTALNYSAKSVMPIFWEKKIRSWNDPNKAYDLLISDGKDYVCDMWYDDDGKYIDIASIQVGFYKSTGFYGVSYRGPHHRNWGEDAIAEIKKFLYDQKE